MQYRFKQLCNGLPLLLLATLLACGGGGEETKEEGGSPDGSNHAPTVTITSPTKAVSTETGYAIEFTASAVDPDAGDSIDRFEWNFGDQTPTATVKTSTNINGRVTHAFQGTNGTTKTFTVSLKAYDSRNLASTAKTVTISIPANAGAKASVLAPDPKTALKIGNGEAYTFRATLNQATLLSGLTLKSYVWNFGDGSTPQVVNVTGSNTDGSVSHAFSSNGTYSVTVAAINSLDNTGPSSAPATVEVTAGNVNQTPVINITNPSGDTSGYTTKPVSLSFTVQDGNGDPVSYTVNWGDGTTASNTVTGTTTAKTVNLSHVYADSLTSTSKDFVIQVTATDNRTANGVAVPQSRNITIGYNTLPTATILTPQLSGTIPNTVEDGGNGTPTLPPGSNDPDVVVIPAGGKLSFNGIGTAPASGGSITYQWTFNGGSPVTQGAASKANAGEVYFAGVDGKTIAYLVELVVKDQFLRGSVNSYKARRKWVVVDGSNTQSFNLSFLYRKKAEDNGIDTLALASKTTSGLNATVQVFQDGVMSSYKVVNAAGTGAEISLPVRSNLPFYAQIPAFGTDTNTYLVRVPNRPGLDPTLETLSVGSSLDLLPGFGFRNAGAPWNPTLNIVTAEGFSAENETPEQRNFVGTSYLVGGQSTLRWIDRLSVPSPDSPRGATQWVQANNLVGSYNPVVGLKNFGEWLVMLKTVKMSDPATAGTAPSGASDLKFVLDFSKYTSGTIPTKPNIDSNAPSASYSATEIQAFRAPKGVTNPFTVDTSGATGTAYTTTNSSLVGSDVRTFYNSLVSNPAGTLALQGGVRQFPVSYIATDPDRVPNKAILYDTDDAGYRTTFSFNEYLWSKVWARPLSLNRTNVGWYDMSATGLANFPYFRYSSRTSDWPALSNISGLENGKLSSFNLNVSSGSAFNPSVSPSLDDNGTPASTGIGRFFWTAYAPMYNAGGGAIISRTWLADGTTHQPPISFPNAKTTDPTPAFGFLPPMDPVVDYRSRNASGQLDGKDTTSGYRVWWYNPTRTASGAVAAPDFWVVVLQTGSKRMHFMLPAKYPTTQEANSPILTDAQAFLPSKAASYQTGDSVGSGYCWFDIPVELRPAQGVAGTIMIVAVKSILSTEGSSYARALNRTDWINSIKTNTANVQILPASSVDISFAHRIPFSFPWDVVVANSAQYPIGN